MSSKRKLVTRTYEEKLRIIHYAEEHPAKKKKDIAVHFDINPKTLCDILKDKARIKSVCVNNSASVPIKRQRATNHPNVEKALLVWFRQKSAMPEIQIDGSMLLQQANKFRLQFSPNSNENISSAWIDRFKNRNGIVGVQKAGDLEGVDIEVVRDWKEGKLTEILQTYDACDIYNADTMALFWLLLPDNSLGFAGQSHHGAKQLKSRITVLVASNMTGTDKLPVVVIGKCKKPRAFKNVNVPVDYVANKTAGMTVDLFADWLRKVDREMLLAGRKIAMVVDNCPAHPPHIDDLSNTEVIFLPPNTTSHTQPMDSGVIKNIKYFYRLILATQRLEATESDEPFSWTILDAVIALKTAWKNVKPETIVNCFKKAGFVQEIKPDPDESDESDSDETPENSGGSTDTPSTEFGIIWPRLREKFGDAVSAEHESYIAVDDQAETFAVMTDDEIVASVSSREAEDSDEEEKDEMQDLPALCLADAYSALRTLRYYGLARGCTDMEDVTDQLEAILMKQSQSSMRQTKLTDFIK